MHGIQVMAAERVPERLTERGGGLSFNSHNFSTVDPMWKFLGFSDSLERYLSNDVFQSNISLGPNLSFFGLGPMVYYSWYRQIGNYFYLSNMNFDDTIWKISF